MSSPLSRFLHTAVLVIVSLLVGSMFGVWRGFDPAAFSPATFVEVQQGAIRGLNDLLPFMGLASIAVTVVLAFLARKRPLVMWLYAAAAIALAIAGIVTRFGNQPINDIVMTWTATPPDGWQTLRDAWWNWHLVRLTAAFVGMVLLINAVFADRSQHVAALTARHSDPSARASAA